MGPHVDPEFCTVYFAYFVLELEFINQKPKSKKNSDCLGQVVGSHNRAPFPWEATYLAQESQEYYFQNLSFL